MTSQPDEEPTQGSVSRSKGLNGKLSSVQPGSVLVCVTFTLKMELLFLPKYWNGFVKRRDSSLKAVLIMYSISNTSASSGPLRRDVHTLACFIPRNTGVICFVVKVSRCMFLPRKVPEIFVVFIGNLFCPLSAVWDRQSRMAVIGLYEIWKFWRLLLQNLSEHNVIMQIPVKIIISPSKLTQVARLPRSLRIKAVTSNTVHRGSNTDTSNTGDVECTRVDLACRCELSCPRVDPHSATSLPTLYDIHATCQTVEVNGHISKRFICVHTRAMP